MKFRHKFILLLLLSLVPTLSLHAQTSIQAGQSTGANILYRDRVPDSLTTLCLPFGFEHYYFTDTLQFDLDNDGLADFALQLDAVAEHGERTELRATGLNGGRIAINSRVSYYVSGFQAGAVIDASKVWLGSDSLSNTMLTMPGPYGQWAGPRTAYIGIWTGNGYLGWLQLSVTHPTPVCYALAVLDHAVLLSPVTSIPAPSESQAALFPNPAQQSLQIQWPSAKGKDASLTIFDSQGKQSMHQSIPVDAQGSTAPINIQHLPPGAYHIRLTAKDKSTTATFIKL
jgi:hypothetical protein